MKPITKLLTVLLITILSSPSWGETLTMDDLVENPSNGLIYKKFTSVPFTGSVNPSEENLSKGS